MHYHLACALFLLLLNHQLHLRSSDIRSWSLGTPALGDKVKASFTEKRASSCASLGGYNLYTVGTWSRPPFLGGCTQPFNCSESWLLMFPAVPSLEKHRRAARPRSLYCSQLPPPPSARSTPLLSSFFCPVRLLSFPLFQDPPSVIMLVV